MKTYVLTVSRYFPTTHKRKGERTNFVCKILHTINFDEAGNRLYNICSNECETSCFRRMIDPKIHTIRSNYELWAKRIKEVQEGKAILSIRYWSGKPYNSKQVEVCQLDKDSGIGIQSVYFGFNSIQFPFIDNFNHDKSLTEKQGLELSNTIAKNDGLSLEDFKQWFRKYDISKTMAIIHFTSFRY